MTGPKTFPMHAKLSIRAVRSIGNIQKILGEAATRADAVAYSAMVTETLLKVVSTGGTVEIRDPKVPGVSLLRMPDRRD
jgi:hypothetical protein